MVDPGTAAAIVQFITLGLKGLAVLCQKLHSLHNAPQHVKDLWEEFETAERFLFFVQSTLEDTPIPSDHPLSSITQLQAKAEAFNNDLQLMIQGFEDENGNVRALRWFYDETKCRLLKDRVKRDIEEISKLIQLFFQHTNCQQTRQLIRISMGLDAQSTSEPQRLLFGPERPLPTINWGSEQATLPDLCHPECELVENNGAASTIELVPAPRRCPETCRCSCHAAIDPRNSNTPRRRSAGSLFGSVTFGRPCSLAECRNRKHRPKQLLAYTVPSAVFQKIMIIRLIWRGAKLKPAFPVQVFISETSDVVRCVLRGDLKGLQRIFSESPSSLNASEYDGWTLLHTAAYNAQLQIVKFLLTLPVDLHAIEIKSRKAFHLAMNRKVKWNASKAQKAIAGCFENAEKEFRKDLVLTPIHIAVLDIYDESDMNKLGEKPGLSELLDFVSEANNATSTEDWSELELRAEKNGSPLFREILDRHQEREIEKKEYHDFLNECDVVNEWSPLQWAAYTGRLEEMKILLHHGPKVDKITKSGRNLFHHAAESGNSEIVAYLTEKKYHIKRHHEKSLNINLADTWKETPLHIAAVENASSVSSLIAAGANVNACQKDHQTPLHYAARAEDPEKPKIVALLADKSSVNAKDDEGCTPIFNFLDSTPCLELLISKGAKVSVRDKQNRTLLHHACREDQPESLELLLNELEKSAITQKDKHGLTPLNEACKAESVACAKLMLSNHPSKTWKDKEAGSLFIDAARFGDVAFLKLVLGLSLVNDRSFVDRSEDARKTAARAGKNKGEVQELLDELNRQRARVVREDETQATTHAEAQGMYFALR